MPRHASPRYLNRTTIARPHKKSREKVPKRDGECHQTSLKVQNVERPLADTSSVASQVPARSGECHHRLTRQIIRVRYPRETTSATTARHTKSVESGTRERRRVPPDAYSRYGRGTTQARTAKLVETGTRERRDTVQAHSCLSAPPCMATPKGGEALGAHVTH